MRPWSFRKKFVVGLILVFAGMFIYRAVTSYWADEQNRVSRNEILHLEINGVILNGKKFLNLLQKYKKDQSVKAIVVEINSPGGAVGPSQEIYYELLRAKQETKKPLICVSTGLIASGGYYAALACDKIVVAPGTMIGSIGVIMEFANLEKLYDWAKIQRYSISSGKFKDSGSEYRPMREDERQLFQSMIDDVYDQFKTAVIESRKLDTEVVSTYADGRVMTGARAVELKFADQIGTFEDAVQLAAATAGLGEDYKVFKPKKERMGFLDFLEFSEDEDELNTLAEFGEQLSAVKGVSSQGVARELSHIILKTKYLNQPLYLMPGYWE